MATQLHLLKPQTPQKSQNLHKLLLYTCTLTERKQRRYSRINQKSVKGLQKDFTTPHYLRSIAKYST